MSTELPETPDAETTAAGTEAFSDDDGVLYDEEVTPEYGVLGFTLRELLIVGVWLVLFVLSFFPLTGGHTIWASGIDWILPIGVPTAAVFLIVLRRFSPDGIRRVGSLGIDQFASVAFAVAAVLWVGMLWTAIATVATLGIWALSWTGVAQVVASLGLVVLTAFAPIIPGLKDDFHGRLVTLAHRNANPVRPVIARPRPEPVFDVETTYTQQSGAPGFIAPAGGFDVELSGQQTTDEVAPLPGATGHVSLTGHASGGGTGTAELVPDSDYTPVYSRGSGAQEIVSDTASIEALVMPDDGTDLDATNPRDAAPASQPFWILAPSERDVHDERGEPVFRIGPTAWALVIEDRGGAFVVRHDDGRIGYLHDISDITKG